MKLQIKNLPTFTTELGLTDTNTVFSIAEVLTYYKIGQIQIVWDVTFSTGQQVVLRQNIPFDPSNENSVDLIEQNSLALHDLAMNIPFLPTPEGIKSFADFNAQTIDIEI